MKILYIPCTILIFCFSCSGNTGNNPGYVKTDWRITEIDTNNFIFSGIGYQGDRSDLYTGISGTEYYIDPVNGSDSGNGSQGSPWLSLQHVIDNNLVSGGNTIVLREGNYGSILIREKYNSDYITVRAYTGERPLVKYLRIISAGNWRFDGLYITQEMDMDTFERVPLIRIESYYGQSENIGIYNCKIYTVWNTAGWNRQDWDLLALSGINISGNNITLENNFFKNLNFGISVGGENNTVQNNTVKNFSGDGMRGNGHGLLFEANLVKNCYDVNDNHDDGFQSFCVNGTTHWDNVTLRRNVILNNEDPDQPHRGTLQGIGCFDGFFVNWVIENNLVIVDHWHGITFMGATDTVIRNNIVLDMLPGRPGPTWIHLTPHKDGTVSSGCTVSGNYTHSVSISDGNSESGNTIILPDGSGNPGIYDIVPGYDQHVFTLSSDYQYLLQ